MPEFRPLPPLLPSQFTVAGALALGVTPRRLRGRDLARAFHGLRSATEVQHLAFAYAPKLRVGEHFSHATALAVVGGWIPDRLRNEIDVSAVRPVGRPRGAGVRGHEARAPSEITFHGLPIAHPADAWCQLAMMVTERELVLAGDALMRRTRPILRPASLDAALQRWGRRRGAGILRRALAQVRPRTDSVAETELRLDAAAHGLPELSVNPEIRDEFGRLVAYGDLADTERKVLLEYDGEQHRLDARQYARDVERLYELARLGWVVVRVNKSHRGAARARQLERVRLALLERGWTP